MSALTEVNGEAIAAAAQQQQGITIPPEVITAVKTTINKEFWLWYETHKNDHVVTVHFWLFQKDVKVSDLQQVFFLLFGAEGEDQSVPRPAATLAPDQQ